jgi:predicted DNA-binding ribbon-helix-helix protein
MIRTQIQLDESHYRKLKEAAARRGASVAQLVRESVEQYLEQDQLDQHWQRLLDAVGSVRDREATDVSVKHDEHLARIYARQ